MPVVALYKLNSTCASQACFHSFIQCQQPAGKAKTWLQPKAPNPLTLSSKPLNRGYPNIITIASGQYSWVGAGPNLNP